MFIKNLAVLFVCITTVYSKRLPFPSYIKRCSISAPDFDDCCLKNGRDAIPFLEKGDKKYGIPNMLPMVVPSISLDEGPNFSLTLKNLHIYGLETSDLKKLKFDLKNKKVSGQLHINGLELIGKYEVNGKILVIPIQGNGNLNVTTIDTIVDYYLDYVLDKRDGDEYLTVNSGVADVNFKRVYFNLTNLFNGNEELGASTNKLLNEEWEQLVVTLKPVVGKTIVDIINSIINAVVSNVPFKEFFLD